MNRTYITSILFFSAFFAKFSYADNFDFQEYRPTLDVAYEESLSNINSVYTLDFTPGTSSNNNIVYYQLNSNYTITPVYYNIVIGTNPSANGENKTIITLGNGGNPLEGYFKDLATENINLNASAINLTTIGALGDITADFVNNKSTTGYGGAIFMQYSSIKSITGDFISNYGQTTYNTYGGAIHIQSTAQITNGITGNFIGNNITGSRYVLGGAINSAGTIGNITGSFIGNKITANLGALGVGGSAIYNTGNIGKITGDFIANNTNSESKAHGGAINSEGSGSINGIDGSFIGNYVVGKTDVSGGAISNSLLNFGRINGSFINNYAVNDSTSYLAVGGAVSAARNMSFIADGVTNVFSGNYTQDNRGKEYNSIFVRTSSVSSPTISFEVNNDGKLIINDSISGGRLDNGALFIDYTYQYNLNFTGDGTGEVVISNDITNAGSILVDNTTLKFRAFTHKDTTAANYNGKGIFKPASGANTVTGLTLNNATFDINNRYIETVSLKNFSSNNSYLSIDVNPNNMTSDILNVSGNIIGTTNLIVNAASNKDIRGQGNILFAQSSNDTMGSLTSFEIFRVYGSPYLYDIIYNDLGSNNKEWYFTMNDDSNPDYVNNADTAVNSEIIAYIGLHSAGIEQTGSMVDNVRTKVAANKQYCRDCGIYDVKYNAQPLYNIWVNPIYYNSEVKFTSEIDADIWGLEAGFDIQEDANNKLGAFISYRIGKYDLSGNSKKYYSNVGSKINIDSYLGGLYYRYDKNNFWLFTTLYGGVQQADIKTKDGMKASTDALQLGGSVDIGYLLPLKNNYTIEPNAGVSYMILDYDTINDQGGITANYNMVGYGELKAGLKLEKAFFLKEGPAKLYFEPSVIQSFVNADKVFITGIGNADTYDSAVLGRFKVGGRYAVKGGLSVYGSSGYTFGSGYKSTSVNVGVNYAW